MAHSLRQGPSGPSSLDPVPHEESYATGNDFKRVWTGNALMQQETILCEFGQICATGNTLMLLETILCKF